MNTLRTVSTKSIPLNKTQRVYLLPYLVEHFDKLVGRKLRGHRKKLCYFNCTCLNVLLFISEIQFARIWLQMNMVGIRRIHGFCHGMIPWRWRPKETLQRGQMCLHKSEGIQLAMLPSNEYHQVPVSGRCAHQLWRWLIPGLLGFHSCHRRRRRGVFAPCKVKHT